MRRTLLLCFIHGFKGDGETFWTFPQDLKSKVAERLPHDNVELEVYPKYETKGDLSQSAEDFLHWLKIKVMNLRREYCDTPWPPNDKAVEVILVAHSMGGFVASDALFLILNSRWTSGGNANDEQTSRLIFPLIRGILAFDTPFNGLSRSMFVYGAFSQYQKVSNVWNIMSATSAGLMSAGSMNSVSSISRTATSSTLAPKSGASSGWQFWQNLAIKSGAAGVIAAGGVAAYRNRTKILEGIKSINKSSIKSGLKDGAEQSYDALGQGLAYINRDSVGQSFAWLSSHLKFVGALLRQKELAQRLERLSDIQGVGIKVLYVSLGENGYWTGGYFVPERAFCAVPAQEQKSSKIFDRTINTAAEDEVQAHMSMFRPQLNDNYNDMTLKARDLCTQWFQSETELVDSPVGDLGVKQKDSDALDEELAKFEESPLDIAAAAAIPLPAAESDEFEDKERQNYLHNLLRISQKAGSGLTTIASLVPSGSTLQSVYGHVPNVSGYMPTSVWPFGKVDSEVTGGSSTNDNVPDGERMTDSMKIDEDDDVKVESEVSARKLEFGETQSIKGAEQPKLHDESSHEHAEKDDEIVST